FAPDESIKAVRYMENTAYVITYEQTDPLFVIDLTDPTTPVITGEVKISGFSSMLVPIDENTVLGIGYHTEDEGREMEIQEGLKIVTFDVSDKNNPKVLDTKVFKNYYSDVQYNPKALLVNFERGDYTIPYSYSDWNAWDDAYYETRKIENRSGVINFCVDGGKINIVDEYVSDVFRYSTVDRCVYVGDMIYMLGYDSDIDCVQYK
ncbi:MAG: beta-propeller domain-containing protein, partial [Ruminococcus sp.]